MQNKKVKNVLIIGAGVAGQDVAREIQQNKKLHLKVLLFLDADPQKVGQKIEQIPVLNPKNSLKSIIKAHQIDEVIIAIPSADGTRIAEYVKECVAAKVHFKIVPRVQEIIEGKATVQGLREVRVEDLLGRPVIKTDVSAVKKFLKGKTILITGAAGSIGSELARQVCAYKPENIIFLDWWENGLFTLQQELNETFPKIKKTFVITDIKDKQKLESIFKTHRPHVVFHAAAYKHVPLMEDWPDEAVKNNVFGTLNVLNSAKKHHVEKFILISTDKAANPSSVMGATKLITETLGHIIGGGMKCITVRFGNVLDSYGSVVPTFKNQIAKGGPVTVTDKRMTRYFMTIPEASQLILKASEMGVGGELFVLDMGSPIKIVDLAENMIRLAGHVPGEEIQIIYTGIRQGEKLHETLFNVAENMTKTQSQKIFITKSNGINAILLQKKLPQLKKYASEGKTKLLRQLLSQLCFNSTLMRE